MDNHIPQKLADGGWIAGLVVWYASHVTQINAVLQHLILLLTVVSLIAAIRYHVKGTPKK